MRIAYVHILPIEYYPPATNAIRALAAKPGFELAVWTSQNHKRRPPFALEGVRIERPPFVRAQDRTPKRMWDWLAWNWACARGLKAFNPDAVFSIEPHSAAASWLYYRLMRGHGKLYIHHHEYYEPKDYDRPGMRLVEVAHQLEKRDLMPRASWISQTNDNRLKFMRQDNPGMPADKFQIWPNYPPADWLPRSRKSKKRDDKLKLVYLGSASFHDTYIREVVEWVAQFPEQLELTISGYNIEADVWDWLEESQFTNVRRIPEGWSYETLPEHLQDYDIGLILYRGNTTNFVYNAPNKLFEYWSCGLSVWYPREMKQIAELAKQTDTPPLREVDFNSMLGMKPPNQRELSTKMTSKYSCESALTPLLELLP